MEPAVFLDRDNTLIANDGDLGDPDLVRIVPGVPAGLLALRKAGFRLVVVTNQAGVARGRFTEADVDAVHQRIASLVEEETGSDGVIDRFYYCPYHPEATKPEYRRDHSWRKPHPGMLMQAARDMGLDLSRSWLIGDQLRDMRAGKAAGCRTVLVSNDPAVAAEANPTVAVGTFGQAVEAILRRNPGAGALLSAKSEQGAEAVASASDGTATAESSKREAREIAQRASGTVLVEPRVSPPETRTPPPPLEARSPESRAADASAEGIARSGKNMAGGQGGAANDAAELRRAMIELSEEIRSQRVHRSEFTMLKLAAGICQLLVVLLVLLGVLELASLEAFAKWFLGAIVAQLVTIALLLLDMRG